jgi:GGDEF domain-containing protein/DNA-binding NarL/FixJ family response regulator
VLAIVNQPATTELFVKVFTELGDRVLVATDLTEGLALAASENPHLAFVDVSLGRNAGLALVHHLRAVAPAASVYALASTEALQVGAQASGLGGAGLIMMPPSGDELSTAAADVRSRLEAASERARLQNQVDFARRTAESATRIVALAECVDRVEAGKKLAPIFAEATGATAALVYVQTSEGSSELIQSGAQGRVEGAPSFADEMGVLTFARQSGCEVVPLTVRHLSQGHVLLHGLPPDRWGAIEKVAAEVMAGQAAMTLALVGERERGARGAMKDLTTSAYTFAYFVDIAGREIDKARRYGRRFALATVALEETALDKSNELAEAILGAVRDTDVLARVDEREFYLLMPETGGVGAQSCRRRVMQSAAARSGLTAPWAIPHGLTMGVATYPHDGTDLSRLLRAAKRRAEMTRRSAVRDLGLDEMPLGRMVDELLRNGHRLGEADVDGAGGARLIELSLRDAIGVATAAVNEGLRGGPTFVAVAHHPELGLSSSIRASFGHEREGLALHILDLRAASGCDNLQVLTVIAEQGAYLLVGRSDGTGMKGVHGSDPLLVDLVTMRSGQTAGVRLLD